MEGRVEKKRVNGGKSREEKGLMEGRDGGKNTPMVNRMLKPTQHVDIMII